VLAILRMGLFQLRILTRIPRHAAVDTAVNLTREIPSVRAAVGFVNAVLRSALRAPVALPSRDADELGHLAVAYSHPRWLVAKLIEWFGIGDAEALMAANNEAAPNAIRLNLSRGEAGELAARLRGEGFEIAARGRFPETTVLEGMALDGSRLVASVQSSERRERDIEKGATIFESDAYREGIFTPQSEASQMVVRMLAPAPGAVVIDCAAAPGGKTTHLAELVGRNGKIVALDLNFAGLRNARALAARLHHPNVFFVRADVSVALPLRPASFEYVLLDAPCTGTGTMRAHPEIRWRLRPEDFARMAALQGRMLENAALLVRPGGAIVYAVCSLAPEEGLGVVRAFLAHHREFEVDREINFRELFGDALDESSFMRTRPDRGGLDGFFAARLRRETL
jgi:16S rRNA (cytosine967-C5)-methyltransferase